VECTQLDVEAEKMRLQFGNFQIARTKLIRFSILPHRRALSGMLVQLVGSGSLLQQLIKKTPATSSKVIPGCLQITLELRSVYLAQVQSCLIKATQILPTISTNYSNAMQRKINLVPQFNPPRKIRRCRAV